MFTRLLKTGLVTLLIPILMACSLFTSTAKPSRADLENEEQAVYAVFVGKGPALILQDTSTDITSEDPQKMVNNLKDSLQGISKATMDSYVERNAKPSQLSTDMQLGVEYTLLSIEELAKISSQPNWHEILREKYPGSNGYLIFSRVGFNNPLDQAMIYVGAVQGSLMGSGSYYLLEKQNGEWKIIKETMVWIS